MMKRTLSLTLALILLLALIPAFTLPAQAAESSFAAALREFNNGVTGKKAAMLADLDGDGVDEMIAVKELSEYALQIGIFNAKNPDSQAYYDYTYESWFAEFVYLSEQNYMVIGEEDEEGHNDVVLVYASGRISSVFLGCV